MSIPAELEGGIRKCLVRKWSNFKGYGFNLHAEKGKFGQYVGLVDEGSPALAAGLEAGDRIVEVNGEHIGSESHQQVVSRIKASGDSVWLLVVNKETDEYCKNNGVMISGDMPLLKVLECPETNEAASSSGSQKEEESNGTVENGDSVLQDNDYETVDIQPVATASETPLTTQPDVSAPSEPTVSAETNSVEQEVPPPELKDDDLPAPPAELMFSDNEVSEPPASVQEQESVEAEIKYESSTPAASESASTEPEVEEPAPPTPEVSEPEPQPVAVEPQPLPASKPEEPKKEETLTPTEPVNTSTTAASQQPSIDSLNKMSAAEMREALKQKKRADPRQQQKLSAKDKLAMFQRL